MENIISYGRFQCRELTPHKNRGMEITYIEKGMMEWMVEGEPEAVESGSIYFTLPWQVHGSVNPKEPDNIIWHVLFHLREDYSTARSNFKFPRLFGFNDEEMKILSTTFAGSPHHCFPATPTIRDLMPALIAELQSTHELRDAHTTTLLRAILVELKRIIEGEVVDTGQYSYSEQKVQELIASLPTHCDRQWTLDEMVDVCGIRRTQLTKVFQKLTGTTPIEYLLRIRMEHAKNLLRETDIKVIDIAFECGYTTSQYFANAFKQATGATPSEYRKNYRGLSAKEFRDWKSIQFRSEEEERQRVKAFSSGKGKTG